MTLYDVERYHQLRSIQAHSMAQAIANAEILDFDMHVYLQLFFWAEAKYEANEICNQKDYVNAMMQAAGIFKDD